MSKTEFGHLIDLPGNESQPAVNGLLIANDHFRVMRLVLSAGQAIPQHQAEAAITVQCLSGEINFTTMGNDLAMRPGALVCLQPEEPHALQAVSDSIVIVTMALATIG